MLEKLGYAPNWVMELAAIFFLLLAILLVIWRLPKVDLGHSKSFLRRRVANWLPAGLTYAFLYMGRYNLNTTIDMKVLSFQDFSSISSVGKMVYGLSFLLNGPLTDKFGGRKTIILSSSGAAICNALMGLLIGGSFAHDKETLIQWLIYVYAANMYFQSFGAVAIVKINAPWFHVRERGGFGGLFGILISLGLYFAYDIFPHIAVAIGVSNAFYVPATILICFAFIDWLLVKDSPSQAGFPDIQTGDATEEGPKLSVFSVAKKMAKNPVIVQIACIEFCSGYLRNILMETYKPFAQLTKQTTSFLYGHWGMMNCVAGILGGMFAGLISDRVFGSRRGPVAGLLYSLMIVGSCFMYAALSSSFFGWILIPMMLAIIGVHGMLSGTASMDFGGKKNTGIAVGVIDGLVYLGGALGTRLIGFWSPKGDLARDPGRWWVWPILLFPASLIGFLFCLRIWNARPKRVHPDGVSHFTTADSKAAKS